MRSPPRLSPSGGSTSLNGLPDIGDPFDVAAFRAFRLPDEQNAFTYLRRASEKLTPIVGMVGGNGADPGDLKFSWSIANPTLREWAGENREAFELFQRGAEQADAANPAGDPTDQPVYLTALIMLALLEASRREESGDTAGAWDCHRAVLRTITHFRRRGSTLQRRIAREASRSLQRRLTDWATGPRTTISQLRTALEVVLENEPKPEWDLFAVKYGYLELMGALEQPIPLSAWQGIEGEWTFRLGDMSLSPEMVGQLEAARRFLLREPERSRRVLRLLCANYLAHVETRGRQPRKPAVWAMFTYLTSSNPITTGKIPHSGLSRRSGGTGRSPRATTARCGRLAGRDPRRQAATCSGDMMNGCHRFEPGTGGLLPTAEPIAIWSSCWPRRSIAASAGHYRRPRTPWSGPISRACPTTDRPS